MNEIDVGEMTPQEAVAFLKLFLDGEIQFVSACENIVFRDRDDPPQGKNQKAEMRRALMKNLGVDAFTANRGMEQAVSLRERRHRAFIIIDRGLDEGNPEEDIVERVIEECDLPDAYARVTLYFVRKHKSDDR